MFSRASSDRDEASEERSLATKPSNATYQGTLRVDAERGIVRHIAAPDGHPLRDVEITWYPGGRVKVTFAGAAPIVLTQAFITGAGRDAILEVRQA